MPPSFGPGHWMRQEILEQPDVVARVLQREELAAKRLGEHLRRRGVHTFIVVGRGSSDHAALLGKYFLEWSTGIPVALAAASLTTLHKRRLRLSGAAICAISQSGESSDVVSYFREAKRAGAVAIAITNGTNSSLARTADHLLLCHAERERSVVATKTFMAEISALYLLAAHWTVGRRGKELLKSLQKIPRALEHAAEMEPVARAAIAPGAGDRCIVLGRGFSLPVALEAALKLKESAGIFAEGASAADFLHGPVAMVSAQARTHQLSAIIFVPRGPEGRSLSETTARLKKHGVPCVAIIHSGKQTGGAGGVVFRDARLPNWLSPFPLTLLGQWSALQAALSRNVDPDHPPGLKKITRTK